MRYKLFFELENKEISIQYRKSILSFFKKSLSEYDMAKYEKLYHAKDPIIKPYTFAVFFRDSEFKENEFKKYYNQKDNIIKPYAFSVFFRHPQINGQEIILEDKRLEMNMTIENYETAIIIYNAFNHQRNKVFHLEHNSMTLKNIVLVPEKQINTDEVTIKFMSPLIVRQRENEKDYYYSIEGEKFLETLKINIKEQLKLTNYPTEIIDTIKLEKINGRKTVIKFYEKQMEGTIGTFKLYGNKDLLSYLYKSGIGSRRSSGFGMFEVV